MTGSTLRSRRVPLAVTVRSSSPAVSASRLRTACYVVVVVVSLVAADLAASPARVTGTERRFASPVGGRQRNRADKAPTWSDQMQFDDVISQPTGRTVHMKCPATGHPVPTIRWFKDNIPFARRIMGSIKQVDSKFQLRLVDVNEYDAGYYTCVVSNKHGQLNWTIRFDVVARMMHAPIITDGPRNQSAHIGQTVRFSCRLLSDPEYHLQWIKHIYVNESYVIANMSTNVRTEQTQNYLGEDLVIESVTLEDAGLYTCVVANPLGVSHQNGWLEVDDTALSAVINVDAEVGHSIDGAGRWQLALVTIIAASSSAGVIGCICFAAVAMTKRRRSYGNGCSRVVGVSSKTANLVGHWQLPSQRSNAGGRFEMRNNVLVYDGNPVSGVTASSLGGDEEVPLTLSGKKLLGGGRLASAKERLGRLTEYEMPLDKQWEFPRGRLSLESLLGEGAFGVVVKATAFGLGARDETKTVAVKMLKLDATDDDVADLIHEMETMKAIGHHVNLLRLLGCCTQGGPLYVIVEYASHGNLRNFLREHRPRDVSTESNGWFNVTNWCADDTTLTYFDLVSFATQVANGLLYLSTNMCIHRDIAARNILVADNYVMKIADFGLTRNVPTRNEYYRKTTDGRLPVKWMSPEALFDRKYSVKSDIWSYGILLWEIFSMGGNPYPSVPVEKLYELLTDGHRMERPPYATHDVYSLMLQCWQHNPSERPSFETIVQQLNELSASQCNDSDMTSSVVDTTTTAVGGETDSQYSSTSVVSL